MKQTGKDVFIMPKNRVQETIFTVMMVLVMVYAMICYNITLSKGMLDCQTFVDAFGELAVMSAAAFVLDTFIAGPLAKKLAFMVVTPGKSKPISVILAISVFSVILMCPLMSLVATVLFNGGIATGFPAAWAKTTLLNLPMALVWQLCAAGPLVRGVFGLMFRNEAA